MSSRETWNEKRTKRDITKQIYILFFHYTRNGISLGMPTEKSVRDFFLTRKMTVEFVCREVRSHPYNIRHSQRRRIIKLMSSALLAPRSVPSNPTPALFSLEIYSMCFYLLFLDFCVLALVFWGSVYLIAINLYGGLPYVVLIYMSYFLQCFSAQQWAV